MKDSEELKCLHCESTALVPVPVELPKEERYRCSACGYWLSITDDEFIWSLAKAFGNLFVNRRN